MRDTGVKSISDFAAEIGIHRQAIAIVVANYGLPTQPMQHGMAKGLSRKTQRQVAKILRVKPHTTRVSA